MHGGSRPLVCHHVLGEVSVYRVVAELGRLIELETVRVPGLGSGRRVRCTRAAVRRMSVIDDPGLELRSSQLRPNVDGSGLGSTQVPA